MPATAPRLNWWLLEPNPTQDLSYCMGASGGWLMTGGAVGHLLGNQQTPYAPQLTL